MILNKFKTAFATLILGILCALNHCEAVQEQDIHFIDSQDVKRYHDNSKLQWDWAMDSLAKLPFSGDEHILDVGCGDGKITAVLAQAVPQGSVVGVDISPDMIDFASKTSSTYSNLKFLVGDARKLSFENQFDVAVSFTALHYVKEQLQALQYIQKSLKPGGIALVVIPHQSCSHVNNYAEPLIKMEKWNKYFAGYVNTRWYFTVGEYQDLLHEAGMVVLSVRNIPYEQRFENREAFEDWLLPVSSHARHLPTEMRREFIHDLVESMMQDIQIDSRGGIVRYSEKLEAIARKPL